ncbi:MULTISPECIES: ABC transporter permease [Arthrobacter]|uniref:ABC transporter permease n=2 Tax=Arthrobacter TaxID=1663 RepID=A0ABU9KJK1_9MICC|nr:ABC transporter permease [Arthrobacter sp. YJM1]MDP5226094.1 ABC transporter permease [Arthrobacter sp. YJM1]
MTPAQSTSLPPLGARQSPASPAARILAQGRYETITMLRNGEQLVLAIVMPLLALFALKFTPVLDGLNGSRIDIAVPGVLALCTLSTAFTGQGISTGFDRRYGVLRFLSTTPLGRAGLISGKVIAVLSVLAVQTAVISVTGLLLGWTPSWTGTLLAVPLLVLGAAAFTSLGLLVAGTVRPEATLALTNLLWIVLGALGGIVVPPGRLPGLLGEVAPFLPSGALGDALRAALLHGAIDPLAAILLVLWTAVAGGLAVKWFKWN